MRKLLFLSTILLSLFQTSLALGSLPKGVIDALKSGKEEKMKEILQPILEVSINGDNSLYSRKQAIQVISRFISENKPLSMSETSQGGKGSSKFSVLIFNTADQQYKATVRYSSDEKNSKIEQIAFDDDLGL